MSISCGVKNTCTRQGFFVILNAVRRNRSSQADTAAPSTVFSYVEDQQILVAKTSGTLHSSSWPVIIKQVTDAGKARACIRYLIDHLDARFHVRFADLWNIPRNTGRFELPPGARIALLLRPHHAVQKQFIEAFNSNRGFSLKVFDARAQALSWLMDAAPKSNLLSFP